MTLTIHLTRPHGALTIDLRARHLIARLNAVLERWGYTVKIEQVKEGA